MAWSDSEDFESADEGTTDVSGHPVNQNKTRTSSEQSNKSTGTSSTKKDAKPASSEGWDDFNFDDGELTKTHKNKEDGDSKQNEEIKIEDVKHKETDKKSDDTGWDDFGDWEASEVQIDPTPNPTQKEVKTTDKPTNVPLANTGWGWGNWGVDSILNSATAGISSITNQVSQGISTVLESGIGAPDPEELARRSQEARITQDVKTESEKQINRDNEETAFQLGSLLSGVTKFVESTGTKVISGGLDTLETIGKKTMEVLQDGDPLLAKKRALLGLDNNEKPILSQVLREAKSKADEEDRVKEEKREAKEVHYETLFDDYEGLVHLEALEMLSKQINMRIQDQLSSANGDKKQEIKETLQQVAELCEMPEDEDDDLTSDVTSDAFNEQLNEAILDMGAKVPLQGLVKHFDETLKWLEQENTGNEKLIYKQAVSSLAQYTALTMEVYHKTGEILLVKNRRSTADEADAMTQMTVVLTKHISVMANRFSAKLDSIANGNKDQCKEYITNIFLEAGNSSTYVQNAFQLSLPILQIGAV